MAGSLTLPGRGPGSLDIAAHYLPSDSSALIGGGWYDAMQLPDGRTLLTVGDLTGHGIQATSTMAMILGALRGMAVAGIEPGALMGHLNQLLETSIQPALGSAVCCRFDPATRRLDWAQAGHPAPLLFRNGVGRPVPRRTECSSGLRPGSRTSRTKYTCCPVMCWYSTPTGWPGAPGARTTVSARARKRCSDSHRASPRPVRRRNAYAPSPRSSAAPSDWTTRAC